MKVTLPMLLPPSEKDVEKLKEEIRYLIKKGMRPADATLEALKRKKEKNKKGQ